MDDIEKIKQKIDIVDFISEYITLKKTGRNFKANCPFHGEKTPSFIVSPERQIWHCFGCGKGGDIFGFLIEYEKLEFSESLKYLADRAGVKLVTPAFKSEIEKRKEIIYEINHLSASFYNFLLLNHPSGKKALDYLENKRKIPIELIKKFNLGYAPNIDNSLSTYLIKKKNYQEKDLIDAGIATKKMGRMVDFFRNRIIFPIYDTRSNVIAFSGRALNDSSMSGPKYINTRETLVYKKGNTLFGLNFARDEIKKENRAILVEGEFDVISSFKEGIKNIVAVKGTALTENQIKILKRFSEKVSFCFDKDAAGSAAQIRSIELIEKEGVITSVIIPPLGKDPDEILKENPLLFKKAIKEDINIYDYIINQSLEANDVKDPIGKRKIIEKALPFLTLIENEVVKEHYFKKLAGFLDTSLESLVKQADKIKSKKEDYIPKTPLKNLSREEIVESYLLSLVTQHQNIKLACKKSKEILGNVEFTNIVFNKIYNYLFEFCQIQEKPTILDFTKTLPSEIIEAFDKCYLAILSEFENDDTYLLEIEKTSHEVRTLSIKNQLKMISTKIKEMEKEKKEEELTKLQTEFDQLTTLLNIDNN